MAYVGKLYGMDVDANWDVFEASGKRLSKKAVAGVSRMRRVGPRGADRGDIEGLTSALPINVRSLSYS